MAPADKYARTAEYDIGSRIITNRLSQSTGTTFGVGSTVITTVLEGPEGHPVGLTGTIV